MTYISTYQTAKICHGANRLYCEVIGDYSQVDWYEASEWQRKSAIAGVEYLLGEPCAAGADSHACWLRTKEAEGWKYGPVKDPAKKEHPCMVPYHELPEEQRRKDALFVAIVRALSPVKGVCNA